MWAGVWCAGGRGCVRVRPGPEQDEQFGGFRPALPNQCGVRVSNSAVTRPGWPARSRWPGPAGIDVLHCPYCHGWEVRDQRIGILATGPAAAHQALLFRQLSVRAVA